MRINEHLKEIQSYQPGKPIAELKRELDLDSIVKLASNENPIGPSPMALAAIKQAAADVHRYPEGSCPTLRSALAAKLKVNEDQLVFGNGSNELLIFLAQAYLSRGDQALMAVPTFPIYKIAAQMMDAHPVEIGLQQGTHDIEALIAALGPKSRIVFVCNPNNPTGTMIDQAALLSLLAAALEQQCLVVVDEAYYEYVSDKTYPDSLALLNDYENLVVCRSFSKIYGLAGTRIGYAITNASVARWLEKLRQPFNVNSLAQAGALAALTDDQHVAKSRANNQQGLDYLARELAGLGFHTLPTQANFLYFALAGARDFCAGLLNDGLIIRAIGDMGVRVTGGLPAENRKLIETLKQRKH